MAKRSPYETGELSDSIFLILLATLEPVHGYRIMQRIKESTQGTVEIGPATMYTTLKKLKGAGWIAEIADESEAPEELSLIHISRAATSCLRSSMSSSPMASRVTCA